MKPAGVTPKSAKGRIIPPQTDYAMPVKRSYNKTLLQEIKNKMAEIQKILSKEM